MSQRVSEAYPELFHYTTVKGLGGIVESQQLWATHWADLNDTLELQQFRQKAIEFVRPMLQEQCRKRAAADAQLKEKAERKGGCDQAAAHDTTKLLDAMHVTSFGPDGFAGPFLTCFCAHAADSFEHRNGLLSQWYGYGASGGVALVFDSKGLEDLMAAEAHVFCHSFNHCGNVRYDIHPLTCENYYCEPWFVDFRKELCILADKFYSEPRPSLKDIVEPFVKSSTMLKHRGFEEEKEIRIVVSPYLEGQQGIFAKAPGEAGALKTLKYRRRGEREVRYIELFGSQPLPIKRVIVGPSAVQNFNHQEAVKIVPGEVEVSKSETPFIG